MGINWFSWLFVLICKLNLNIILTTNKNNIKYFKMLSLNWTYPTYYSLISTHPGASLTWDSGWNLFGHCQKVDIHWLGSTVTSLKSAPDPQIDQFDNFPTSTSATIHGKIECSSTLMGGLMEMGFVRYGWMDTRLVTFERRDDWYDGRLDWVKIKVIKNL